MVIAPASNKHVEQLPVPSSAASPEEPSTSNQFNYSDIVFPGPDGQGPLGPPPAFTPYEADWFEVGEGDVVSHDEHLNTDGEALYRFLLTQATQAPPRYRIHVRGSHTEIRTRWRSTLDPYSDDNFPRHQNNYHHFHPPYHHHHHHHHHHHSTDLYTRTETYTERVSDFDFYIDVVPPFGSTITHLPSQLNTGNGDSATTLPEEKHDTAPVHWSVGDAEPAYRGKMVPEVELGTPVGGAISLPGADVPFSSVQAHPGVPSDPRSNAPASKRRKAKRRERKSYEKWAEMRTRKGLPPWVGGPLGIWDSPLLADHPSESEVLKSSKTVREWADEYCASRKLLKEFVYTKVLYGWDIAQLESAIRSTIIQTHYLGDISVTFTPVASRIYIRPSNTLSRILSHKWLKFLTIILCIFPFIWLFKRFHSRGGGRWEVCGGAYALKKWVPVSTGPQQGSSEAGPSASGSRNGGELPSYEDVAGPSSSIPSTSHPQSPLSPRTPSNTIMHTPQGTFRLLGQREGEWFRAWQPTILRAVLMRYVSLTPLISPASGGAPGTILDGYWDASGVGTTTANQHGGQASLAFGATPMMPGNVGIGIGGPIAGGPGFGVGGGLGVGTGVGTTDGRVYLP